MECVSDTVRHYDWFAYIRDICKLEASHGRIMCAYHVVSLVCMPVCMDRSNSVVPVLAGGSVFIFPLHIGLLLPGVSAVLT